MKFYQKQYKNYFRADSYQKKLDMDKVNITGRDKDTYDNQLRAALDQFYDALWFNALNLAWLSEKFEYDGEFRDDFTNNSKEMNTAWKLYFRRIFNKDTSVLVDTKALKRVASYVNDFYPGFYSANPPWEKGYNFPYDNINLDYLMAVWRLEDRLEMLEFAEDKEMSLEMFYDWVLNWICCYNEEYGETYTMKKTPFVEFKKV